MLKVTHLNTIFHVGDQMVHAVDNISFSVENGQTVGLVGESGSGKSVTALSIMNLLANNGERMGGEIELNGQDLSHLEKSEWPSIWGREIGMIFQNPQASLNPVYTIGNQLIETIMHHQDCDKSTAHSRAVDLLKKVNIADPVQRMTDYPHQLSGGMCQRIMIAITLAMNPKLLIADEPTAALDVTIQAQIIRLLTEIKQETGMSILMISHDLGVIAQFCDYVYIMYLGKIVEEGPPSQIFKSPQHPYTQALIGSVPSTDPENKGEMPILEGEIPSPLHLPTGCRFHPRCPQVMPECRLKSPVLKELNEGKVACFKCQ